LERVTINAPNLPAHKWNPSWPVTTNPQNENPALTEGQFKNLVGVNDLTHIRIHPQNAS